MKKKLFNRSEFVVLTGIRHQTTYELEKKGVIVPHEKEYSLEQLVFGRFLSQARKAFNLKSYVFQKGFGNRMQYEVDWSEVKLGCIAKRKNEYVAWIVYQGQLPVDFNFPPFLETRFAHDNAECCFFSGKEKCVRDFIMRYCRFLVFESTEIAIANVGKIRKNLIDKAMAKGLSIR